MELTGEKRFFKSNGIQFRNYTVSYSNMESNIYQKACNIPIDKSIIKDSSGDIINLPDKLPDKDSTKKYMKYFAINKGIGGEVDLRKGKQDILEQIYEELNINKGDEENESTG